MNILPQKLKDKYKTDILFRIDTQLMIAGLIILILLSIYYWYKISTLINEGTHTNFEIIQTTLNTCAEMFIAGGFITCIQTIIKSFLVKKQKTLTFNNPEKEIRKQINNQTVIAITIFILVIFSNFLLYVNVEFHSLYTKDTINQIHLQQEALSVINDGPEAQDQFIQNHETCNITELTPKEKIQHIINITQRREKAH